MTKTLAHKVATLDRERFTGRTRELALLERMLDGDAPGQVVLLHGPGGIGKSALLRELARRAAGRGFAPRVLDGRELMPVPGEIERALGGLGGDEGRPLLIFDSYERMGGADGWLRRTLVPSLPESSLVILAGRRPPATEWFRDGWEHLAVELELAPLTSDDARALLTAYGVPEGSLADELVRWAKGWPLALSIAASAPAGPAALVADDVDRHPDLLRAVVSRVAGSELDQGSFDAVAVAAIARSASAAMLRSVLPDVDAESTLAWLRQLTFAERVGDGVSLHDLVRRAMRSELETRDPERARDLRRRIADHVHDRAVGGEPRMLIDLTELIDDPALRWGLGAEASVEYRVDSVRPGDADALAPWYATRPRWWRDVAAFLVEAPEHVVLARDARDRLVGVSIAVTLTDPPAVVESDAVLGPWLAHARRTTPGADVLLWRDATDFERYADPASPVVSLMNTAAILHCGLANVRYSYIPIDPRNSAAKRFSRSVGGRPVEELTIELDGRLLECHVIDHGEGGMIGQLREIVYAELRLPPGPPRSAPAATAEDVRDALRNLHRPTMLARSPLATGLTSEERAASVRSLVHAAAIKAFGATPEEQLLRAVLERGYLDPDSKHEQVAEQLNLSRTAYFRRLRQASERLAAWLLERDSRRA